MPETLTATIHYGAGASLRSPSQPLRSLHHRCVGCEEKDSAWSQMGACALHTVIGRNSRRRKGLEPSRRLSETTGPQSPSGYRIAFQTTEVTDRAARFKHEARRFTHRAPKARCYRPSTGGLHLLPRIAESRFTCYRRVEERGEVTGARGGAWSGAQVPAHAPGGHAGGTH